MRPTTQATSVGSTKSTSVALEGVAPGLGEVGEEAGEVLGERADLLLLAAQGDELAVGAGGLQEEDAVAGLAQRAGGEAFGVGDVDRGHVRSGVRTGPGR